MSLPGLMPVQTACDCQRVPGQLCPCRDLDILPPLPEMPESPSRSGFKLNRDAAKESAHGAWEKSAADFHRVLHFKPPAVIRFVDRCP